MLEYPLPENLFDLHRFLRTLNAYHRCIKDVAILQAPLHALMHVAKKKDMRPVSWDDVSRATFEACKNSLAQSTLLTHLRPGAQLRTSADALDLRMDRVLKQLEEQNW